MNAKKLARIIAFYLPQFHPIPENDEWWGQGFTEWTNVKKANPLYEGHNQPRVPGILGYYDLRDPEVRLAQANLAREHGIEAFCYWHYWFGNGRRLLERPFDEVLASGEPDFPFCLCWANETWTGIWHGAPKRVLIEQTYPGEQDEQKHFASLLPAFHDHRYVRVNNKPLFAIYKPDKLPDPQVFTTRWQRMARAAGLDGLFLVALSNEPHAEFLKSFDAVVNHGPGDYFAKTLTKNIVPRLFRRLSKGKIADFLPEKLRSFVRQPIRHEFSDVVDKVLPPVEDEERFLPCILAGWDNTPRSSYRGVVFENFNAGLFQIYLQKALLRVNENDLDKKIIFIKAWNEWAEGNYLEPDQHLNDSLLKVVRDEIFR